MEWKELLRYLREGSTETAHFFKSVDNEDDLLPTLVAMANTRGGKVFIGVDSINYHLVGTKVDRGWVEGHLKAYCYPALHVEIGFVSRDDKVVMVIDVPDHQSSPFYFKKVCYVMDGASPKVALLGQQYGINAYSEDQQALEQFAAEVESEDPDIDMITDELVSLSQEPETTHVQGYHEFKVVHQSSVSMNASYEQTSAEELDKLSSRFDSGYASNSAAVSPFSEPNVVEVDLEDELDLSSYDLNDRQMKVMDYLKDNGSVKNKKYRGMYGISHKTAHLELADLVEKGLIEVKGSGRSTRYQLKERIAEPVVSNGTY